MFTMKKVELVDKHEFVKAIVNENSQTLIVHVALLKNYNIHLFRASLIAALQQNKVSTKVSKEYTDYGDIFCLIL